MDTNKQREHYTIESGKQLIRVSNLLITHIGVSLFFLLVVSVSLQSGNTGSLLVLNLFFVVFSLVVLGMSIYSLRMSGVNLIKSINPNYQPSGIYVVPSSNPYTYPHQTETTYGQGIQHKTSPESSNPIPENKTKTVETIEQYWDNGKIHKRYSTIPGDSLGTTWYDGDFELYNYDGQLEHTVTYKKGKMEGLLIRYYKNGKMWEKTTYVEGVKEGPFEVFYDNGNISERGSYSNDRLTGLWESFTIDGKLKRTKHY